MPHERSGRIAPVSERLRRASVFDPETGCRIWVKSVRKDGYGRIGVGDGVALAHKAAWELLHGPVPEGLELDHRCRRRRCIEPAHLEPIPHRENVLRGVSVAAVNATKDECVNGHAYTPENTYQRPDGGRDCRACICARVTAYRTRRKAA